MKLGNLKLPVPSNLFCLSDWVIFSCLFHLATILSRSCTNYGGRWKGRGSKTFPSSTENSKLSPDLSPVHD